MVNEEKRAEFVFDTCKTVATLDAAVPLIVFAVRPAPADLATAAAAHTRHASCPLDGGPPPRSRWRLASWAGDVVRPLPELHLQGFEGPLGVYRHGCDLRV